jgi:hypothetical protein
MLNPLEENLALIDIKLTVEELKNINNSLDNIRIADNQYPKELEKEQDYSFSYSFYITVLRGSINLLSIFGFFKKIYSYFQNKV